VYARTFAWYDIIRQPMSQSKRLSWDLDLMLGMAEVEKLILVYEARAEYQSHDKQ
jgi:hypothetical protein